MSKFCYRTGLRFAALMYPSPHAMRVEVCAQFPACAQNCGSLFDAQGGCVHPILPAADEATANACFCSNAAVANFKTGIHNVCDNICKASGEDQTATLVTIQNWFADLCDTEKFSASNQGASSTSSTSGTDADTGSSSGGTRVQQGTGGTWLQNHLRWVIMAVVIVVAIIVIWIGACIWRRCYLKKKERQMGLGKHPAHASWGPGAAPADHHSVTAPGMFLPPNHGSTSGSNIAMEKSYASPTPPPPNGPLQNQPKSGCRGRTYDEQLGRPWIILSGRSNGRWEQRNEYFDTCAKQ
ncbi:unnamed protein product [Parascedosporium putredinis]|uniref:Integral membrane protein n=1 Tax=Parascedosporium putredinis TaxID=1442378 RepID=A0A9P1H3P7_9PEZI|nr:unnamed protein product [Parascedosporium putredinis]CAI7997435.1 unnamed protein product [Parascedosporium putredinis]